MHKLTRITAAVLLSLSMASTGVMAAYADETTTPPAETEYTQAPDVLAPDGGIAADPTQAGIVTPEVPADGQIPVEGQADAAALPAEGAGQQTAPMTFSSDDEANLRAVILSNQYGLETFVAASALRLNGFWTPSFICDDTLHNQGNGWYSMQMVIRNNLGNLIYRTYSSTVGWSPWVMNGQETAHLTDGSAVEAVQVRIAGVITNEYDLYYRATLSDGTVMDWATNGQTAGTMGKGKWMIGFQMRLVPKNNVPPTPNQNTVDSLSGTDGVQLQANGLPTYKDGSGFPFTGWGWVNNQRYYFVNDQAATGWQYIDGYKYYFDETTGKLVSDLRDMLGYVGPYMLKINRVTDTLTVYAQDGSNGYILPIVSFLTTTGDDTPYGTFQIPEKYRWRLMYGDVYTQYAMRLKAGYMVHSVIFNHQNPYTLDAVTYNNLGVGRSHGCTRLKTGEVKWIYDNCPVGTTVTIYDSMINGPFEAPVLDALIPADQNYDPTDPSVPEAVADMQAAQNRAQAEADAKARAEADAKAQAEAEANGLGGNGTVNGSTAAPETNTNTTPIAQPGEPIG